MTDPEAGATPADSNLAHLLWRGASIHGARPAIIEHGSRVDHAGLRDRAAAIARALTSDGIGPGDPVATFLDRGAESAAAFFGILAAGAVAVVINEALRPRQVEHILTHSGARRLITTGEMLARLPRALHTDVPVLDPRAIPAAYDANSDPVERRGSDVAQIVYTSGSTGAPKGVAVSHGNLNAAADVVTAYLGIEATDRIAGLLTLSSVYGMSQLLCAVRRGAALVVERAALPQEIVQTLRREGVTVLAAVPPLWLRLLNGGGLQDGALPDLRLMTNAGGHLPVDAVRALRTSQSGARLFLMYGLTEVLRSTFLPPEEVDRRPDSIGRAIPGAEVFLVDEAGRPVAPGETGELVHRGPTVALGYWNDPALSALTFRADPRPVPTGGTVVFSGDLARQDADGFLYYVSRKDRVIKAMGYRIGPDEIVDVLHASGQVSDAEVVGEPDPTWGTRIVAYVTLAPAGSVAALKAFCARELPRHMQPARYEVRGALPLLPSGKHDLAALTGAAPAAH